MCFCCYHVELLAPLSDRLNTVSIPALQDCSVIDVYVLFSVNDSAVLAQQLHVQCCIEPSCRMVYLLGS